MKAQIIENYCEEPNFILRDNIPIPEPKANEVLVKLKTASVNPVDYKLRAGAMKMISGVQFPCILGKDGSGIVEKIGSKITRFKVGDEVCGFLTNKRTGRFQFVFNKNLLNSCSSFEQFLSKFENVSKKRFLCRICML